MAEKRETPQLDELEKGPWPSFVTQIKRAGEKNAMADDLLGLLETSYEDKVGHWKHGVRVEGLMFSSMSMGQKAGSGFTSAIMGAILSMAAFDGMKATAAEQTVEAIATIEAFYLYVPIALWVIMFLIAACYKLDKTYDKMMNELLAREGKSAEA